MVVKYQVIVFLFLLLLFKFTSVLFNRFIQDSSSRVYKMKISANEVADTCYNYYKNSIPNKNKPVENEWTTLASILSINQGNDGKASLKVLCLTTGTKCLPEKLLPFDGSLIHDSHAEVLARRCFIR